VRDTALQLPGKTISNTLLPSRQRIDKDTDEANRKASGAAADPFRNVLKDKIPPKNPDWHKNEAFESPEEFPFASSAQEGSK